MYVRVSRHVVITSEWLWRLETNNAGQQGGRFNWLSPNSPIIVPEYNPTLESWLQIRLGSDRRRRAATKDQLSAEHRRLKVSFDFPSRHPDLGVNSNSESQKDPADLFYSAQMILSRRVLPFLLLHLVLEQLSAAVISNRSKTRRVSLDPVTPRAREFNEKTGILVKMNL